VPTGLNGRAVAKSEIHREVTPAHSDRESANPHLRGKLIEHFINLSGTLTQESSVAGVAEAIGTAALALTGAQKTAVYRCSVDPGVVSLWSRGFSAEQIDRIAAMDGIRAEPVLLSDLASWPMVHRSKPVGVVVCGFELPRDWSSSEIEVALALALHGGAALARTLLLEDAAGGRVEADQDNARIAEALRLVEVESAQLLEAQAQLEAHCARILRTRQALGGVNVWMLALQHELRTEQARLAAEQTRVLKAIEKVAAEDRRLVAVRETLGVQLTAADETLESESARLAAMCRAPVQGHAPETLESESARLAAMCRAPVEGRALEAGAGRTSAEDDTRLADIKRWLSEIEHAKFMEAPGAGGAGPAESPDVPQTTGAPPLDPLADTPQRTGAKSALKTAQETLSPQPHRPTADPPFSYELGGPLPAPGAPEDMYPMLVDRAAELLHAKGRPLTAEQQLTILGRALDDRDGHRAGYGERLAQRSVAIAALLGCGQDEIADIHRAALLHDLGKIAVPEKILHTARGLSDEERTAVRLVPIVAEQVLRSVKGMERVATILRHRYEQWEGRGYPDGLHGTDISLGARILAVTDTYGVMTTERRYRTMIYRLDAVAELKHCAGKQFDPKVIEAFCIVLQRER
jgi:HD-GYP domain-containing protein (c-di-GMP phosphodiesterase class II)